MASVLMDKLVRSESADGVDEAPRRRRRHVPLFKFISPVKQNIVPEVAIDH